MMPCTLNKRPNRITVLNESTKQILSNFTPINFYFTEFELVHYSLIDWLSYACQASFRLVDSTASKKRIVHLDSEIELFQFHFVLCRGLRCNVMHIWTSYIAGDLKGMKVYANRVIACLIWPHFIERAEVYNFVLQCFYFIINETLEYLKMNKKVWMCKICWIIKISFTDVVFLNSIR